MKPRHKRLVFVGVGLGILGLAAFLVLNALDDSVVFFHTPTEIAEQKVPLDRRLRLGGLVEEGSVLHGTGAQVRFRVTDLANDVAVTYSGILPDLFREGQGVVVEGRMHNGVLTADQVLAKHDEKYMPPEVAEALKKSGQWQGIKQSMQDAGQLPGLSAVQRPAQ
ncbi:MAG: cytochrome c maturation protein CcmE [Rhodospirillales bacterium]|nr:cytochrome c maturation protein CcmE [Rhodospirillales bacterium]